MLSSPDNFTGSAASGQVPASPGHEEGGGGASSGGNMRGFGLAEVSSEDEARRDKPVDKDAGVSSVNAAVEASTLSSCCCVKM